MNRQSGNALFLILIAVALFAALSYAITQSGRGGGADKETVVITASQVVEQQATVRTAITRMVITGTASAAVKMDDTPGVGVFAPDGGGATKLPPPPSACNPPCTGWTYFDLANAGSYIAGVGTTAPDAIAWLPGVTLPVCSQILKGLGLPSTPAVQQGGPFTGETGPYMPDGGSTTLKAEKGALDGQAFACLDNGGGSYAYYHALIEQ